MIQSVLPPSPDALAPLLLSWYDRAGRTLPWRGTSDLYAILVSELMLQQTRVDTVLGYFGRFMERFPTATDLAAADEEDVMAAWAGLGFYRRARNLHRAAQQIVTDHGGRVPEDPEVLGLLPGIGRYTVGAILSSGRNAKLPILDGNVIRVLTRVYSVVDPPDRAATQRVLWGLAEDILPSDRPGDFNQAIMDLGATLCRRTSPSCPTCPFTAICTASANGTSEDFPCPGRSTTVKKVGRVALLLDGSDGRFLLNKRPPKGLLASLWELPSADIGEGDDAAEAAAMLAETSNPSSGPMGAVELNFCGTVEHRFSHRHWVVQVFRGRVQLPKAVTAAEHSTASQRVDYADLELLGVPTITRKTIDCALRGG
jgi:A/G-specific adenine glycosylase